MALKPPNGDDTLIPVVMFPNQGKGFGYGTTTRGENGTLPEGYDRTINMSVRDGEILTPSFATTINQPIADKSPAAFAVPWSDASGTPIVVVGSGNYVRIIKNAAVTLEVNAAHPDVAFTAVTDDAGSAKLAVGDSSTFAVNDDVVVTGSTVTGYNGTWTVSAVADATHLTINATYSATATGTVTRSAEYSSACLWDDNATSGAVPYLYAGTKTGRNLLNYRTRAGVWAELSDTSDHKAIFVAAGAGKLWGTPDDYHIRNWPSGTNPNGGTPSSAIAVGSNAAKITSLGVIGAVPVVGKEDGIWIYNTADTLFERAFEVTWNANNFPFMESDGAGGLYTATADGALVQIERFGTIKRISPTADKPIGRDTPHGRIVDVTTTADFGYALMDNGWRRNERVAGFTVFLVSGLTGGTFNVSNGIAFANFTTTGTYADYTALVTDGRDDTYLDLSDFDTLANGDALLIGASNKFLLSYFRMVGVNAANARFRFAYQQTATQFLEFPSFFNGTDSTPFTNSTPFGQSGFFALNADQRSLASVASNWATRSLGGTTAYWMLVFTT